MIKKIILLVATLAIISIAFMFYQSREAPLPGPTAEKPRPAPPSPHRPDSGPRSTQPTVIQDERAGKPFDLTGAHIPAGEEAGFRVFDPKTGRRKYYIHAVKWEPVGPSGTEFAVTEPSAEVLLPRGQVAYVRADEGQVVVARGAKSEVEPKRGWFKGNVRLIVDRTTPKWREEHPEVADPIKHPEAVIKFWLDDVKFDLEQGNLSSEGPIRAEAADGALEGRGLELFWSEENRRLTKLSIAHGGKATLRSSKIMDFGVSGAEGKDKENASSPATTTQRAAGEKTAAVADATTKPSAPTTPDNPDHAKGTGQLSLVDVQNGPDRLKENRIDVYHLKFRDNILAEQHAGMKTTGGLKASAVEVLFEVGQSEREAAQSVPGTQPAQKTPKADRPATAPADDRSPLSTAASVVITWAGDLTVIPEEEENPEQQRTGKAERVHLTATGDPVELFNHETGQAVCQMLQYFNETKQVWLTGTPINPVQLASGLDGELIGEDVFFDVEDNTGVASMDGPGKLVFKREQGNEESTISLNLGDSRAKAATTAKTPTTGPAEQARNEMVWKNWAEIQFGSTNVPGEVSPTGEPGTRKAQYLKKAIFDGSVALVDPNQSMSADHVEITFLPPRTTQDQSRKKAVAEGIRATGHVRVINEDNYITCDTLEIDLTADEFGNNVPLVGRAIGHVVARQGQRKIEATDVVEIHLASVPRPVSPEERAMLEAKAKERHLTPESPEWQKAVEARMHRVRTVVVGLKAHGEVDVRDPKARLEVIANDLDCVMNNQQQITKATILGTAAVPAHVETSDFYIRGPRILMDVITQSAEVPGAGMLRFFTTQDLDGKPVDKPLPVVVTWNKNMLLDGQNNEGTFSGMVRATSESSTLDCRELFLRFQDLPKPSREPEGVRALWVVRPFLNAPARGKSQPGMSDTRVAGQLRKRLSYLRADGAASGDAGLASMELKSYDQSTPKTVITRVAAAMVPTWLQDPTKVIKPNDRRRLASGAAIFGPRIAVDLIQQQLSVEGKGSLLVRDYRVPAKRGRDATQQASQDLSFSSDSLTGLSPGHTAFTWLNGMSFLSQKNVAVFDRDVRMEHRSGSELPMSPELASVTGLDAKTLATLKGRHVAMTSDHLLAEFDREAGHVRTKRSVEPGTLSQATRLKVFVAAGRVHMAEGTRSLDAAEVSYHDVTGLIRALGTAKSRPQVVDIDEATGQRRGGLVGQLIEWNVKTGDVRVVEPKVNAMGR